MPKESKLYASETSLGVSFPVFTARISPLSPMRLANTFYFHSRMSEISPGGLRGSHSVLCFSVRFEVCTEAETKIPAGKKSSTYANFSRLELLLGKLTSNR